MDKPQEQNTPEVTKEVKQPDVSKSEEVEKSPIDEQIKEEKTEDVQDVQPEEEPATVAPGNEQPSAGKKFNMGLLLVVGIFVVILLAAGLFGLWYFVLRDKGSKNNNGGNTATCTYNAELKEDTAIEGSDNITAGSTFTKSWQVKNTGTCEWKGDVKLSFVSGDPTGVGQTITVPTTAKDLVATVSINLTAPDTAGTYQAIWKLKPDTGDAFGDALPISFVVKSPTAAIAPADLIVTEISTSTDTVRQGVPFNIIAKVKNQGGKNAVGFTVAWRACSSSACPYINFPNKVTLPPT